VKGSDCGYKLSELLSDRRGSAHTVVNIATADCRFGAVLLTDKLMFDNTYEKIAVAGSYFGTHG